MKKNPALSNQRIARVMKRLGRVRVPQDVELKCPTISKYPSLTHGAFLFALSWWASRKGFLYNRQYDKEAYREYFDLLNIIDVQESDMLERAVRLALLDQLITNGNKFADPRGELDAGVLEDVGAMYSAIDLPALVGEDILFQCPITSGLSIAYSALPDFATSTEMVSISTSEKVDPNTHIPSLIMAVAASLRSHGSDIGRYNTAKVGVYFARHALYKSARVSNLIDANTFDDISDILFGDENEPGPRRNRRTVSATEFLSVSTEREDTHSSDAYEIDF